MALILTVCGNRDTTYSVVLFTLPGADLLLWKLLAVPPLLSVCGLWFSETTAFSSLTRDLSCWVGLSCCLFGFRSQSSIRKTLNCVNSGSDLLVFAGVQRRLKSNICANSIRCFIFNSTLRHKTNISLLYGNYFAMQ